MKSPTLSLVITTYFYFLGIWAFGQFTIPPKPLGDSKLLFNEANVLNSTEEYALNQKLINYEDSTSTQIVVACVTTLYDDDPNLVAAQWGEKWGIGQADEDNGLVILIATKDRKMAIQNGYGLEPLMTDMLSKRIIDYYFIPNLRNNNYYKAIDEGTDAIFQVLNGEFIEDNQTSQEEEFPWELLFILGFFIVMLILISRNRRNGGGKGDRFGGGDVIFTDFGRSTWHGSGGFGSGSGGGFGGFGGGSFGGGGASGSW